MTPLRNLFNRYCTSKILFNIIKYQFQLIRITLFKGRFTLNIPVIMAGLVIATVPIGAALGLGTGVQNSHQLMQCFLAAKVFFRRFAVDPYTLG